MQNLPSWAPHQLARFILAELELAGVIGQQKIVWELEDRVELRAQGDREEDRWRAVWRNF
jgi:hypothetical protein